MKKDNNLLKYIIIGCFVLIAFTIFSSSIIGYSAEEYTYNKYNSDEYYTYSNGTRTIHIEKNIIDSNYNTLVYTSNPSLPNDFFFAFTDAVLQTTSSSSGDRLIRGKYIRWNLSGSSLYEGVFNSGYDYLIWYRDVIMEHGTLVNGWHEVTPITYNSDIIASVGKLFDDRVSIIVKVPHGFDISTLSLNTDITYTLPSNQYVTDLVTDLRGIMLDKRYKPIVNSTYKKTWGQSHTTRYRYNVTLMTEITQHEEDEIYGDTYYYSIPLDILELGTNTLNNTTLSNINSYPEFVDGLVTAGYISRISIYPYTTTSQGVIKISDTNVDNEVLVNYAIPKLESEVTNGDVSAAQTQAYIDNRNAELNRRLQEYVYNPNIEAGKNIVEKLNSIVNTVTGMIGTVSGVGAMFGLFFTCLPTFVLDIISFTIISLCIISIYKALRG